MSMLVTYASAHGATRGIAERIAKRLVGAGLQVDLVPVEAATDLAGYDGFVIGSAIYGGSWRPEATELVRTNAPLLTSHPVWLFSSGPTGKTATMHEPVEPKGLRELRRAVNAREHKIFAGAWDRSKMDPRKLGFAERVVAKRFVPEGDFRDWAAIDAWADHIAIAIVTR